MPSQSHRHLPDALHKTSAAPKPPLVGRNEEMRQLEAALDRAATRRGGTIFLHGEAGIGKTRLAHEALALARSRRFVALEGRAYPLESGLAYGLILDVFGPFLRTLDPVRRTRLTKSLPDLGRLFSGLHLPVPEPLGDSALEKSRLFDSLARFLELLTNEAPVALFFDDLHWADPASLEILHYLSRGLLDQPVLVLAAYRTDEVDTARGLRQLLGSLRRAGLSEELAVPRLGRDAVQSLAESVLGSTPPPELLCALETRAAGTPLFVQALVHTLLDSGQLVLSHHGWTLGPAGSAVLPTAVRDVIVDRLDRLDSRDRRVLDLVAVNGDATSYATLRSAARLDEEALADVLRRLVAHGLLLEKVSSPEVAYTFTHPVTQEVAYAELTEIARRRAHAIMAAAIEERHPDDLDRMAQHYLSAGPEVDRGRSLEVLLAVGERAWGLHANEAAARWFGAALALVREGHRVKERTWQAGYQLPVLLERLGQAWERVGEGTAAVEIWTEALAEYSRVDDIRGVARVRRWLSLAEWDRGHFDIAQHHLAAGLEVLTEQPPGQELADLYFARLEIARHRGDAAGLAMAAAEASALAERLRLPRLQTLADFALVIPLVAKGDFVAARKRAVRALPAEGAASDPMVVHYAYRALAEIDLSCGEHACARQNAERSLASARVLGVPSLESVPRTHLTFANVMAGDWEEASRGCFEALALARRVGPPRRLLGVLALQAIVLALRGDFDEADACVEEARKALGARSGTDRAFSMLELAEAMIAIERRDRPRARSAALSLARAPELSYLPPLRLYTEGEALVLAGEPISALGTAAKLATIGRSGARYPLALAARVEGIARAALGESEIALASLWRAAGLFESITMPFEAARARLEWATLARSASEAERAAVVRESLATFRRLEARSYAARARRLLRQLGVRSPALRRAAPHAGPLSERELEVARLIAEGLTTPEIARRLIVSPRTITTHLDRIYARLGINSRAALARYVTEAGMLVSSDR